MLSDESSSDSETGRFKCQSKSKNKKKDENDIKKDSLYGRSSGRFRRSERDERFHRDMEKKRDDRERFERRSRERHRYSRYSPVRRRHSGDRSRNRRTPDRHRERHTIDSRDKSKQRDIRSSSKDKSRRSRSRSYKSPAKVRNIKDEIKVIITGKEKSSNKGDVKSKTEKSVSPEIVKKSAVHKPAISETKKKISDSPILIEEIEGSDASDVVQPGSYYKMIPAIVKEKSEESSEIDSSDDEKLRAKLLNLEKELQKTKKKKHKKKHKRKSSKGDKEKQDSSTSVEVSSTTDIQEVKTDEPTKIPEAEVTSTQKTNIKESSEEGEILSDDNSQSDFEIDPTDLRHKLKRSKVDKKDNEQNLDVCGPALPPHLEKRFRKSLSPASEGPSLPPQLRNKSRNIGKKFVIIFLLLIINLLKYYKNYNNSCRFFTGPSIPENMRKVLAESSEADREVLKYESSDDDGIGPLPVGAKDKWSEAHQRLEERAMEMKIKTLDGHSLQNSNIKSREQWMLELPEGKAKYLGLEARSFRAKAGPDMSDR